MSSDLTLTERKQRRARQRIIAAADALFAARGFDAVSVGDIVERAEVGRTTFFRYFGDKQEVVFAREQELLDLVGAEQIEVADGGRRTLADALVALEPVILRLCEQMSADWEGYRRHLQLVEGHPDLAARDAAKMQIVALRLRDLLVAHQWATFPATFAAEIALACYWTARHASTETGGLVDATRAAFRQALELGADPSTRP